MIDGRERRAFAPGGDVRRTKVRHDVGLKRRRGARPIAQLPRQPLSRLMQNGLPVEANERHAFAGNRKPFEKRLDRSDMGVGHETLEFELRRLRFAQVRTSISGEALHQLGQFAWVCCLAFLICCAWRLARFNVQGMAPGSSKYFVGMPTPAAAGVIASIVHGFRLGGPMSIGQLQNGWWAVAWFLLAASLGGLMTSTIRYYSFKDIPWTRKQPSLAIVLLCLLVGVIWRYSEYALMTVACSYAFVGLTLHIIRFFRHRLVSRTA